MSSHLSQYPPRASRQVVQHSQDPAPTIEVNIVICARSVGPFGPPEQGLQENCFEVQGGNAWNIFILKMFHNQSTTMLGGYHGYHVPFLQRRVPSIFRESKGDGGSLISKE